jgi:hypothetical protein
MMNNKQWTKKSIVNGFLGIKTAGSVIGINFQSS